MSRQIEDHPVELFPLARTMDQSDLQLILQHKQPILLLSQIKSIDRLRVEQLERIGIYDSEDFFNAGDQIADILQIDHVQYEDLIDIIRRALKEQSKQPRSILELPKNYALVAARITSASRQLAILWRGMYWSRSVPRDEYWNVIKHEFDQLLMDMGQPKLIGRLSLEHPPQWLDRATPLATYLSNLPFDRQVIQIALLWGMTPAVKECDLLKQELLAAAYLIKIGHLTG